MTRLDLSTPMTEGVFSLLVRDYLHSEGHCASCPYKSSGECVGRAVEGKCMAIDRQEQLKGIMVFSDDDYSIVVSDAELNKSLPYCNDMMPYCGSSSAEDIASTYLAAYMLGDDVYAHRITHAVRTACKSPIAIYDRFRIEAAEVRELYA